MRRSAILAAVAAATLLVSLAGAAQAAPAQAPAVDVTSRHAADARQAETSKRLSALAEAVVDAGAPGAIVARRTSAKDVVAVAEGRADTRTGRAAHPADRHRIGSMTKTMVAVVVLQLVEEGRLGLDDSVAELLPEFELDPRITVRHLLLQTSGFRTDTKVFAPPRSYEANRFRYFRPEELVEIALTDTEPRPEPGTRFQYSNTNYVLAGLVIEAVTGRPVEHELRRRILAPLSLRDTWMPSASPVVPGRHLRGYLGPAMQRELIPDEEPVEPLRDTTVYSMSWAWTAGAMVSTVRDQTTFMRALFQGRLLSPEMLEIMTTPGPDGYAMALVPVPAPCVPEGVAWGHDGMVFGYEGAMFSTPDGSVQTATVGNAWLADENGVPRQPAALAAIEALCPGEE